MMPTNPFQQKKVLAAVDSPQTDKASTASQDDPWAVVSTQPTQPSGDPWAVVSTSPDTSAPQAKWGSSVSDVASTIGQRLKNLAAGPYHAFTDPSTPQEQQTFGQGIDSPLAHVSLGVKRMLVDPTTQGLSSAAEEWKAGNKDQAATTALQSIPVVGPWEKQIADDATNKGGVAALAGLGTDIAGPLAAGKALGVGMRVGGKAAELATTTPESRALYTTRKIVPGTPGELLSRGLKPSVAHPDFEASVNEALPSIVQESPISGAGGVKGFATAAQNAADGEQSWYRSMISPYEKVPGYGTAPRPSAIAGNPITQAQMNSIPITNLIEDPPRAGAASSGILARTSAKASNWDRNFDVPTLDAARQDLNAKLNSFWNQSGGDRAAARSNPEVARTEAASNATRDVLYPQIAKDYGVPEETIRGRQNLFGHLSDVADVANRRATVYGRQSPLSLQESLALQPGRPVAGALDFAGQRLLKNATGSDALVNSAVDRFRNPTGTPLPPARGAFPQVSNEFGRRLGIAAKAAPAIGRAGLFLPRSPGSQPDSVNNAIIKQLFAQSR